MVHAEHVTAQVAARSRGLPTAHAGRIGWVCAAVVGLAGEGVALTSADSTAARWNEAAVAAVVLAYAAVGVLVLWHRPGHPVGRIAVGLALAWGIGQALVATSYDVLVGAPHDPAAAAASVVGAFLRGLPWMVAVLVLPLLLPEGRRLGTRLATVAWWVSLAALADFAVVSLLSPTLTDLRVSRVRNPLGLQGRLGALMDPLAGFMLLLGTAAICLAVAVVVQRYRRTGALGRQQTLVFAVSFVPPVAAFVASMTDTAGPWLFGVASLPVPVAIGAAVLQHRLYDITLAVNRSLTYGALSVMIAGLYAVTVGGVGAMLRAPGAPWLPWVAAGVVAVSFAPLRNGLQQAANKLTYGQWSQPAEVLASTGRRLADATDTLALLATITTELAGGLGLAYVEIRDGDGRVLARHGGPGTGCDELPLTAYGVQVGVLRWDRRRLRDGDRALLVDVAHQLGGVVHAAALVSQVRDAQERLVLAREEERKRLRRDLHDGLGPALAGLTFGVDTLRNQLTGDRPVDTDTELRRLRDGISSCVADVRRIVEGLRPPDLDELGLAGALGRLVSRLSAEAGVAVGLDVGLDVGGPAVPAAVEVAAYRVAQEALTNVVRHSSAGRADVHVAVAGDRLVLEVRDDGVGAAVPRPGGVGLSSMHERARELGGSLTIASHAGAGTLVRALLPLAPAAAP